MALGPGLIMPLIRSPSQLMTITTRFRFSGAPHSPLHVPSSGKPSCAKTAVAATRPIPIPAWRIFVRAPIVLPRLRLGLKALRTHSRRQAGRSDRTAPRSADSSAHGEVAHKLQIGAVGRLARALEGSPTRALNVDPP